jgi:hypothetical protein
VSKKKKKKNLLACFCVRDHGHGLVSGSVNFERERRTKSGHDSPVVVVLEVRDDGHALVVGDVASRELGHELERDVYFAKTDPQKCIGFKILTLNLKIVESSLLLKSQETEMKEPAIVH